MKTQTKSASNPPALTARPAKPYGRKLAVSYHWRCDEFRDEMPKELREALDEHATERIAIALKTGLVSGELNDDVVMKIPGIKTPPNGFHCTGWFDISEVNAGN